MRGSRFSRRIAVAGLAAALAATFATGASGSSDVTYRFPVMPGTAAWRALATHDDMVRATQVPEAVVARMSTRSLASTVLAYPLFGDVMAFNNVQHGVDVVASRSNAITALLERKDSGTELLRRYRSLRLSDATVDHAVTARKLEWLLAQGRVLAGLSGSQLDALITAGLDAIDAKRQRVDVYGTAGLEPTAMMLGRAATARYGTTWPGGGVVATGYARGADEVRDVVARVGATRVPVEGTGVGDAPDTSGTVKTPRGSTVAVTWTGWELSSSEITYWNNYVAQNYPNATRETNTSRRYNCHSYAWYSQSTSNTAWMNSPGDDKYWQDGSYTAYNSMYHGYPNLMKASYASDDHSGIEDYTRGYMWIRSKWGQLPRMYHYYNYSPYNSTTINRYTNAPIILP